MACAGFNWNYLNRDNLINFGDKAGTTLKNTHYNRKELYEGRAHAGFTILELILSLSLTSLLLGLLSTGIFTVANDWTKTSDSLDDSLDETIAILQIERALHGAFPHSYLDEDTLSRLIFFYGEDDELSWVSTVSPQRDKGLMAWQLYSIDDEGVYLKLVPAFSDNPYERLEEAEPRLLLANYTAEFRYLYEEFEDAKEWRDDWIGYEFQSLPLAVHILLTPIDDGDGQFGDLELVARILNFEHRNIRPTAFEGRGL